MLYTSANGRDILLLNNKRIICFNKIPDQILNNSLNEPDQLPVHMIRTWGKLNIKDDALWEYDCGEAFAMVRCANAVVLSANRQAEIIEVLDIKNGNRLWSQRLASSPLPWGLIVDHAGRIIVTLRDGQIMCYGQRKGEYEL